MQATRTSKAAAILAILVLSVVILVYGKPFFIPLAFAALLSMLLLPVTRWLQAKGVGKALSILLPILLLAAFIAIVVFFVSWQVSGITENASKIEQQVTQKYQQAQQLLATKFGVSMDKQKQMIKQQQAASSGRMGSIVTGLLNGLGGFVANLLLNFVYIFLFLYFRGRIKGFIVRLVPASQKDNALVTIDQAQKVAQEYLKGLFLMIVFLWIMYSIGFSIAGVKNAFFFAVICGLLEIVPFVGNLTGTVLTLSMSLAQGGSINVVIGILVTYAVVQFIQSYLLEPLVVGAGVSINPMATIIGLIAFELLWGIPGMVLAIPLMGIAKIVCDHVPALRPYAYLIGQDKKQDRGWKDKIGEWAQKVKARFSGKRDRK